MTVTPINSVRKKSVTAANAVQGGTGVVGITFMSGYSQPYLTPLLPELPPYWSYRRDYVLSLTPQADMHWANALSIAYSKFSSLSWTVDGDVPLRVKTAQELLNLAEGGQGWVDFSYRLLADYLTTDNGLFIEIVRATSGAGSKIIGLMQLDSLNCLGRDSRVSLADGTTMPIEKMVRNRYQGEVLAVDNAGNVVPKKVIGWHETKLNGRYWLHMQLKHAKKTFGKHETLWLTNDHEVLTGEGWQKAEDINVGDLIVTKYPAPTFKQSQMLVGAILGDGQIRNQGQDRVAAFGLTQGHKQRAWLERKKSALKGFSFTNTTGLTTLQTTTSMTPSLLNWYNDWYPERGKKQPQKEYIEKYFSPLMMATWYMDDGDLQSKGRPNPSARFSTHGFAKEDVEWLAQFLTGKGFDTRVHTVRGLYSLYMTTKGSAKFFEFISPYVPEDMRYKIPQNLNPFDETLWDLGEAPRFLDEVEYIRKDTNDQVTAFCIDVEDEHNFVAAGMVVHNCIRTGDPETPVIYYDRLGVYHEMKAHQVIFFADSPSPRDRWYGIGFCAASRAYEKVRLIAAIERSLYEKITGGKPDTMDFITGITDKQLKDITNSFNADRLNKGAIVFGGSVLTAFMSNENISHVRIPFAGLPEDFDIEKERREARLEYANAIGLDPQDLQPLSGGGLGNGQQSKVLAAKGHGKGLASFEKALVHRLNEDVFPDRTTFAFNEKDFEQEKAKAEIKNMHATFVDVLVKDGTLTTEQARQVLLDAEAIPEEFVQTDMTANVSMSDSDNSDLLAQYNDQNQQAVVDIRQAMVDQMATKEVARQLESATRLYQELLLG